MKQKILLIDDEPQILRALERFLGELGFQVHSVGTFEEATSISMKNYFDAALIDLKLGDKNGVDLLTQLKKNQPDMVCILMTGYGTIDSAVQAIKKGAFHYLMKPFQLEDLENLLKQALESSQVKRENLFLKEQAHGKYKVKNFIGVSQPIKEVYSLIEKVTKTDSNILILGESGTGKELVAKAIHYNSPRSTKPLVTVNCGAIPEDLLESELFGHVKGAFTGAVNTKPGRFAMADEGTVFLDEIGEMSMKLQVKILRILQERKFEPVGSNHTYEVDVRIIAATNRNLEEAVKKGHFREDLYYRLNVIPIQLPPLRERKSDIPLLIDHFLNRFSEENQKPKLSISSEAMEIFKKYQWPGNIRELENVIERLAILKREGEISKEDVTERLNPVSGSLSSDSVLSESLVDFKVRIDEFENQLILKALEQTGWNKNRAAKLLKLNRTTLVEKIKKRQLEKNKGVVMNE